MDGDFYTVVQVAGAPECPFLEYVDIKGDKDNCPDIDYDNLPNCEDKCLCTGQYCKGQGPHGEHCGAAKHHGLDADEARLRLYFRLSID